MSDRGRTSGRQSGRSLAGVYRAVGTWIREHPRLVDVALATPLLVLSAVGVASVHDAPVWWMALLVAGGQCGPVLVRRDRPMAAFVLAALAAFAQWLLNMGLLPANIVLFAALYNVASRCRWHNAAFAAAVVEIGAVLADIRWFTSAGGPRMPVELIPATILIGSMWIWGNSVRTRRAYLASLRERAVQAERERDNQAHIAAATERARIAREMHDVVSHSLSVMVVQANGAAYSLHSQPDRAEQAVMTIRDTGQAALTEMRRMLGVLRDGEPGHDSYTPQPGVAQLDQLVEEVRAVGLPVELFVEGEPRALPTGMELAVYRIVQEALTNTRKHAGPHVSRARVWLWYGADVLEMRISDNGRGAATLLASRISGGHGLVGMQERVAAYGGSMRSGPRTGGGFEVVASFPLDVQSNDSSD